jgi:hypothetical protein
VLHARNRGVDTLLVHVLAENTAMLKIARNAGAKVERDGGEALARVRLPAEDFRSRLDALVEDGAAEIDYQLKLQARRVADALEVIDDVRTQLRELRPPTTPE